MKKQIVKILSAFLFASPLLCGQSAIENALQKKVDEGALSGAVVMVASKDKIPEFTAVGWQDIEEKKPMRKDSLFWIASQTKPVTAVAFMMLVEEGKISLDDPLHKYLPEFKNMKVKTDDGIVDAKNTILIRHLLSHMSGLPFAVEAERPRLDMLTLERGCQEYAKTSLIYEPGEDVKYSNAGINVLGRLIEILSGKSYTEFLEERIINPLGMKDTTFIPTKEQLERLVTPYGADESKTKFKKGSIGQLTYPLDNSARQPMPAGGLFSTAEDMMKFCRMLLNGGTLDGKKYLSAETVKLMSTRATPREKGKMDYGLGFATGAEGRFGHGGAFKTNMAVIPAKNLVRIYMVQCMGEFPNGGVNAERIFQETAEKLAGE